MLESIKSPADIKSLDSKSLAALAEEIREKIVSVSAQSGGHLASNLGMVEATIALHRVEDCPRDSIVFDVGHQCYAHKLLTGRYESFASIRTLGGISGFTNRGESEYDVLTAGHSGSALPCALGIARAKAQRGDTSWTVAVIGDGSFTNGMVYETLNSCMEKDLRLIIVLNDNEMSISRNVGGIPKYFTRLRNSKRYFDFKRRLQTVFGKIPVVGHGIVMGCYRIKEFIKHLFLHTNFFENMGLYYMGPADGNDERKMELLLREATTKNGCTLIHMITLKGKGYEPAEKRPDIYHFAGSFDPEKGVSSVPGRSFSTVFGSYLCAHAGENDRLCAVTAAMADGTGLGHFAGAYPDRFFDVGIAEGHGAAMAAGLARQGMLPVFAVYSSFLQRSYDMLIHDVAISGQHVVLAVDRAGLVGEDGQTHHGAFDVGYLRQVPGMKIFCPASFAELQEDLQKALYVCTGPAAIRYPRGTEGSYTQTSAETRLCEGYSCTIVCYGTMINAVLQAADTMRAAGYRPEILKLRTISPVDWAAIEASVRKTKRIFVFEETSDRECLADKIFAHLIEAGIPAVCHKRNLGRKPVPHGSCQALLAAAGLDAASITQMMQEGLGR